MALDILPLTRLDRGQLHVMRVHALFAAGVIVAAAAVAEGFAAEAGAYRGIAAVLALPVAVWLAAIAPQRRWRHWGYAFTGSELHVAHGWLTRSHMIVPVLRVQHIDVTQGPIERLFGVTRLVLHTAGSMANRVELPGIARPTAESIRDSIRQSIGSAA